MNEVFVIAGKEIKDGLRNRWVIMITLLMAGLALVLALLGSAPTGVTKVSAFAVTIVSLSSLSIFFIPLIALLLSYNGIVGERERGTLLLLLAYPIARWQVILGKFLGYFLLLSAAIVVGFGFAGLVIALMSDGEFAGQAWGGFLLLIGSSVLLGAVFLALGLMISVLVREQATAAAIAVGVWLLFVVVYDLGLLGLLASDKEQVISNEVVTALLLFNPADAYRMLNLFGSAEASLLSGLANLSASRDVPQWVLAGLLVVWTALPIGAACWFFQRRAL